jgi:uncharacterized membrane-anchored protein YjiN (DUF445 family)
VPLARQAGVEASERRPGPRLAAANARRSHIGTVSLLLAVAGAVACRVALRTGPFVGAAWLQVAAAGFDAALVGGLADWFAVTALFRHPLGLPIPHTAILPRRRARIVEGIVAMVEKEWLSPDVIGVRLARFAPSEFVVDWLRDPAHSERLAAPLRDILGALTRVLTAAEVVAFLDRALQRGLREVPIDASAGRWLMRVLASTHAAAAFQTLALSLATFADRPDAAAIVRTWVERAARALRQEGKRWVPLLLRRPIVQRKIVEAACAYASIELRNAAVEPSHPLRRAIFDVLERVATRLASGDTTTLGHVEQLRQALLESLEARPMISDLLTQLRQQLEGELVSPEGSLSPFIERQLRSGIVDALQDPQRRAVVDQWVRATIDDLLRRHHHHIGLTVRENLDALDTTTLIAQIEERVGADLQFIRLNGAVVGGLVGLLLALVHRVLG